jgi:hypothetical protein
MKHLLFIMLIMFLWSANTTDVEARQSRAERQCFDAVFYAETYPEVAEIVGNSEARLLEHYLTTGRYEGRSASSNFNLMSYRSLNRDLYIAFADDLDAYPAHYLEFGINEGRIAMCDNPPVFEPYKRPLIQEMAAIARDRTDIGITYVELDLTAQHLYLFVNGEVVMDTAVVTGNPNRYRSSPAGIFKIFHKGKDRYLTGPDWKVWVSYWMPFTGNIGFHDATWRSRFGGTIYQRDGSRGCINMPLDKAEILFEHSFVGMFVICH